MTKLEKKVNVLGLILIIFHQQIWISLGFHVLNYMHLGQAGKKHSKNWWMVVQVFLQMGIAYLTQSLEVMPSHFPK